MNAPHVLPSPSLETVLLVEDTPALARLYEGYLRREDFQLETVDTGGAALQKLAEAPPDVMLLDLKLPDLNGMEILGRMAEEGCPTKVIVATAHGSIKTAVEAMQLGAFDFLIKPFDAERLRTTLRNALERARLEQEVALYREDFARDSFHGFIGGSLQMQSVYGTLQNASASRATVFITGESGTGKEVCARAIHSLSPRTTEPFIALNCGAIPKDLMESEIFGHVKGAFTGAVADRAGAARQANGGTLFLDELCEMDLALQTKLLRFLQSGTFTKVGGTREESVDVRFVCATNRDPLAEVAAGRFREDLYYRLHVIPIHLPPLRDRDDDVLLIARSFLEQYTKEEGKAFQGFARDAELALLAAPWPGNVRQLQNVIRNIVVLNEGTHVTAAMFPPLGLPSLDESARQENEAQSTIDPLSTASPPHAAFDAPPSEQDPKITSIRPLWRVEKETIENAITLCDGNIPKAAVMLEISASTIYRKRASWEKMA